MKLRLKKFDPAAVGGIGIANCFTILIGKRGSGKTTLLKDILSRISSRIDICMAVSPTDDTNEAMRSMIPESLVHRELSEDLLNNILWIQRKQWRRGRGSNLALILDDVAFDKKLFDSKAFKELAFNGRHLKITVLVTLQYAISIPPVIRSQADCVITLGEKMLNNRKRLYENFFGNTSFQEFCAILDKTTNNFEALVLWNRSQSNEISDSLMWYKADHAAAESVQMCGQSAWKIHKACFVPETMDSETNHGLHIVTCDQNNKTILAK